MSGACASLALPACSEDVAVPVPRRLLREVIADGCCPLHLRLQLAQALAAAASAEPRADKAARRPDVEICLAEVPPAPCSVAAVAEAEPLTSTDALNVLSNHLLASVAEYLPLPEVLAMRTCSREPLQWAMQRGAEEHGQRCWVHDRIRTRLWMQRIADLTRGTKDESWFETEMRSFSDEALRTRMETEMQEALSHMEDQIRRFQAEVDRRLEEQEQHVRRLVEERVQQELDTILASEVAKVQAMVEERVRERVSTIFRHEVRETVRELQGKLDALVHENRLLHDAFAEANLRSKSLFWALRPPALQMARVAYLGLPSLATCSVERRAKLLLDCGDGLVVDH